MEYPFSDARLASVWKSMALHSKYLGSFETVHQFLLAGDGPLPIVDRHYIAIMVTTTYLPTAFYRLSMDIWTGADVKK